MYQIVRLRLNIEYGFMGDLAYRYGVFDDGAIAKGHSVLFRMNYDQHWNMQWFGEFCVSVFFRRCGIMCTLLNWNNHISAISKSSHNHRQRK